MLRCNEKNPASHLYCSCPESNHEETSDKLELRDIPQINWPIIFKCQELKCQGNAEGLPQIEDD